MSMRIEKRISRNGIKKRGNRKFYCNAHARAYTRNIFIPWNAIV